ncbi:hypothetical protein QL285_053789 [Trifolium repens]|jgi:hypothetical protein|nr:hypothetical protein QL285_053789 [Trifolium repens]
MLGPRVHHRVVSKRDSREIVTENKRGRRAHMKLLEKCLHPKQFSSGMGKASILCLCARSGNHRLFSGPPGNEVRTKVDGCTRGATSIIRVRSPISITEGM